MEQAEYKKEQIQWEHIEFVDNQSILDMMGQKPTNIFSLIDEESKFPKGTDDTMLLKLHDKHAHKSIYLKPKYDIPAFGIQHFAGSVSYNTNGFLEKNRDLFSTDLKELIFQSKNKYLVDLFEQDRFLDTNRKSLTLSAQFRNSLDTLMKTLSICHPFFIRCIKPNDEKTSNMIDKELCVRQLRYSGVMETANIRRSAYATRYTFKSFVERYRPILVVSNKNSTRFNDYKAMAKNISQLIQVDDQVQYGLTKIFLKEQAERLLDNRKLDIYLKSAIIIQRNYRIVRLKRRAIQRKLSASIIQNCWRGYVCRKRYRILRHGLSRLQALTKSRVLSRNFYNLRNMVTLFQAHCRGFNTRCNLHKRVAKKQTKQKLEFIMQRRKDEVEFKRKGHANWKDLAEEKYLERLRLFNLETKRERQRKTYELEENIKIIDDEFDFLNLADMPDRIISERNQIKFEPEVAKTKQKTIKVKQIKTFFEEQSKIVKNIPSKFLSRPVKNYDSSRL